MLIIAYDIPIANTSVMTTIPTIAFLFVLFLTILLLLLLLVPLPSAGWAPVKEIGLPQLEQYLEPGSILVPQ
jgi:hypothetical protein